MGVKMDLEKLKSSLPVLRGRENIESLYGQLHNKKNKFFLKCDDDFITIMYTNKKKVRNLLKTYEKLKASGINYIPDVISYYKRRNILVTSFPGDGNGVTLEKLSGLNAEEENDVVDKIYQLVQKLHNIELPKKHKSTDWFKNIKKEILKYLRFFQKRKLLSEQSCQIIKRKLFDLKSYFEHVRVTYIHDDLTGKNICYNMKSKEVYFIDWDTFKIADPNIDWVKTITHSYSPLLEKVRTKYYPDLSDGIVQFYHIRTYLYWLKFLVRTKNDLLQTGIEDFKKLLQNYTN